MTIRYLVLALLILLPVTSSAQPEGRFDEGWTTLDYHRNQDSRPDEFSRDDLLPDIPFGMHRALLMRWAEQIEMQVTRTTESSVELARTLDGMDFRMVVGFHNDSARSIAIEIRSSDTSIFNPARERDRVGGQLAARAELVDTVDGAPVYFHRTSKGVAIGSSIRTIGFDRLSVEIAPGELRGVPVDRTTIDAAEPKPDEDGQSFVHYGPDEFLPGIAVDMTRDELELWAVIGDWAPSKTLKSAVEYELVQPALSGRLAVTFAGTKARSMSLKLVVTPVDGWTTEQLVVRIFQPMMKSLGARAQSTTRKGKQVTYLHTTSDGRKIRTTVTPVGPSEMKIESSVAKK